MPINKTISELRDNSKEISELAQRSKEPIFITNEGEEDICDYVASLLQRTKIKTRSVRKTLRSSKSNQNR